LSKITSGLDVRSSNHSLLMKSFIGNSAVGARR
jgi:hypothetical protein